MNKKLIRLTEQDLHKIVEESVTNILSENGMEEGLWGGLGTVSSKFGNRMKTASQNMTNSVGQKFNQARNAVGQKFNQAKNAVGQAYNDTKQTYQVGSANQDAQKAIQNAIQALNNLKAADQKLQSIGQYSVIGQQASLIDNLINTLGKGAASISGRFQNKRNAFTN